MAPTIQIPAEDTLKTLQNVLRRRNDNNKILKERKEKMLSGEDYRLLRVDLNNTQFLQPLDAENTKASIYYIRQKFIRYCNHIGIGHWRTAILAQNCDKGIMMLFLHWVCETYLAKKQKKGKRNFVNANDSNEVIKYINGTLKIKFGLDTSSKPKPVAGPDDLLLLLTQHWSGDESVFPTEDDRHDVATIMLFQSYTGGRPAEFVHSSKGKAGEDPLGEAKTDKDERPLHSKYTDESDDDNNGSEYGDGDDLDYQGDSDNDYSSNRRDTAMAKGTNDSCATEINASGIPTPQACSDTTYNDFGEPIRQYKALCYEDICLWIVQNPQLGGRDLLAMEVHLRHHKGVDNKPKPTTFLFRENPLPILCPISHILTRAIRDDAILVDGYRSADPFFTTDLRGQGMKAVKVHWKPEWLAKPIFRRSISSDGGWVKSKIEPMTYSTYAFYIDRLARDTGFEDKLTSYCFRRGTANAVDGAASDAVRDQVMRHDPFTGVFNGAYINNIVRFNVQDAFLESEISDDGLTRAFTYMSIRCNPGVPKAVPAQMMSSLLAADPNIVDLEKSFKEIHTKIKWEHKFIKCAPEILRKQHELLRKELINAKKSLKDEIEKEFRKDYFFRVHNEMMEKQLHKQDNKTTKNEEDNMPNIQYQLDERYQVQKILCDFSKDLCPRDVISRKISAINLMVALASRQEFQTRKPRSSSTFENIPKQSSTTDPLMLANEIPMVCTKTQCIVCVGNERLPYEQITRSFRRVAHMWDHVEKFHLRNRPAEEMFVCSHPVCKAEGLTLDNLMRFKNHVARVHGIQLRP
ncbi:hypothetical protein MFRU_030g00530 [Monilinia fructicola]|nr:hypothetical protein MFRU_030g00530 [Monilinia fructicola]